MITIVWTVFLFVAVTEAKVLPPGAFSKEFQVSIDALWTFDPAHHNGGVFSSSVAHLRNLTFTTDYLYYPDRAVLFPGISESYMYIPNPNGDFSGSSMGSWFFYIFPDNDFHYGSILEYEGPCPSGSGLSIQFVNNKIQFKAKLSDGTQLSGVSQASVIPYGQWSYVGVMWHVVYPEIRVTIDGGSFEPIVFPNINQGQTFQADGTVRIGSSFDPQVPSFKGRIGCLSFQKGYYLKTSLLVIPKNDCDPNLRTKLFLTDETDDTTAADPTTSGCNALVLVSPMTSPANATVTNPVLNGTTGVDVVEEKCAVYVNGTLLRIIK